MPTYEVDVQGKTYEVDAPDANTAWQWANYTHKQAPTPAAPTKAAGFSLANTALGLGQGVIGAGKALTDVFGADNAVSAALGRGQAALGESKTPERQAEQAARQAKIKAAEGTGFLNEIGAELGAVVEAPIESTAQAVGSFAPYLLTGLVGAAARLLPATVRVINGIVGAAQGTGSIKGSIYDAVYNELRGTMPEAKAKEQAAIAQEYNAANALDIAGGAVLGALGARTGVESQLIKGAGANAPAKFLPRLGQAVAKESPLEGAQGGQEKIAQNRALQRAGFDVDTFQGVAGRAAGDAALGALAAGAVSTVQGGKAPSEADPYAGLSTIKDTGATEPATPASPTTPLEEVPEYVQLQRRRLELISQPRTPENKAEISAINKQIEVLNIKLVEDARAQKVAEATDEAKASQSAFSVPPEGAQIEMAGVNTTDQLPPEVDASGNPLNRFVGPDTDVGLRDVIAAELPPTTDVLRDAGIAPTRAELEAAGQQQLGFPNPISEAEVTAFGASMSKTNRQWLADNLLGKTPDQVRDEVAAKQLVVPENKGIQKVVKEIVANVTPKETQNAPSTQPTIQPTPRARGRKPSVDVSVPPTADDTAAPGAGTPTGQPAGPVGQRLVPPEQPIVTRTQQQGVKPPTLKRRVEVDTAEIARQQEAADIAARLGAQAQASALGKPAPEQRTVVEDQSKANRAEAVRRSEEAAQKLEAATTEEAKAAVQQKASKAGTVSTAQIVGALKELVRSPQVSAKDKQDAKRHLDAVQEKKGKDVAAGKEDDLSDEMAFNFLVEQANKPRFQRTETPAKPMSHEKVKAIVAGIVAKLKNAPEVIVVRDMNDAAVPQAVRDHNNEQLAGGAKGSPAGFYHDGKVYIVSSQVSSEADVVTTLAHEALGHFGLRGVFGTALDTELKTIETTYKAEMEAVAAKYGLDLSDPKQASEAAEEVLANLAQTKPTLGIVQRAVAAIRAFIRKIMPSLQMTNNDIIAKFILPARAFVESGVESSVAPSDFDTRFARVAPSVETLVNGAGDLNPPERGMFTKFMDAFAAVPGVDRTTAFRTQTADIAATVESRIHTLFDGKVRDALGNLNPMGLYRQAQDHAKMLLQYLQVGNIEKEAATGLWKVTPKEGVRAPAEVYTMLEAWGKQNGYSFDMAKKIASRILEGVRLNQMRISNRAGKTNFQLHAIDKTSSLTLDQQINEMLKEYNAQPELQEIAKVMDKARIALVDHMVDVGRLTPEMGKEWREVVGYVPFDRMDDFAKAYTKIKRSGSRGIAQVGKLPELVGSYTKPVGDVFGNYMNTLGWMMRQVIHTDATVRTLGALESIQFAKPLGLTNQGKENVVSAYVNGELNYWQVHTKYDEMAFKDLNIPQATWIRNLGTFSNILRTTVTALPPFALKQVTDDVQRAIMTSGVKNPAALVRMTLTNFPKLVMAELRGIEHPMVKQFGAYGLSGEYDFQQAKPADSLLKDMKLVKRSVFKNLLHKLDGITRASDLAVRAAIYEQTIKESQGDTLLAQTRAREFINFRRRGSSEVVGFMVTTIPFFNAYVQGMDVLYRAASGKDASASTGRAVARSMFVSRAVTVAFISSIYALSKSDDDDYNNMDLRQRDSNWLFPGGYKLPVPGELGAIFKVIPERVVEYMRRQGTPEEQTAFEAVRTALSYMYEQYLGRVNPFPQAVKPLVEAWANKSFLTGRNLEGFHHIGMDPSMRRTEGTSELAIAIANFSRDTVGVEVSPIMIDNSLRGYFGSTAAMVTMVTDSLLNPDKVDRPLHKYALLSNYMTDPTGTRKITEFYDERDKSMAAKNTLQELMKVDVDRAVKYAETHQDELIMAKGIQSTLNMLEKTRAYRKYLNGAEAAQDMTADEREAALKELKQMEVEYVAWVREAKATLAKNR
jgi:hypothetical protein